MPRNRSATHGQIVPSKSPRSATTGSPKVVLALVATPIGNLGDITERAKSTLLKAHEIWCEDTRVAQKLLQLLGEPQARCKWVRMDQHSEKSKIQKELERVVHAAENLAENEVYSVALISDAGTPGVSDPGGEVVSVARDMSEIKIEPIPGASSFTALLSVAGILNAKPAFVGFLPKESPEKLKEALCELSKNAQKTGLNSVVFFESPHRIEETLVALRLWLQETQGGRVCLAKELSKIHERIYWIDHDEVLAGDWSQKIEQDFDSRGEWVGLLDLSNDCVIKNLEMEKAAQDWEVSLDLLLQAGVSVSESTQLIVQRFFVAKNLAYQKALEIQKKYKK